MQLVLNFIGVLVVLGLAYLLSYDRKSIDYKIVGRSIAIQFVLAFILVKFPIGIWCVTKVGDGVSKIIGYSRTGMEFVFGSLTNAGGAAGYIFALQALGTIVFVGALINVLNYVGILGYIIAKIGKAVKFLTGSSQLEGFVCSANMFMGDVESPMTISQYLHLLTKSEMMVIMVSSLGSMSANILGGYVSLGMSAQNLIIATALVPVTSIALGKIIMPETEQPIQVEDLATTKSEAVNAIDALAAGAYQGIQLIIGICATLAAMISFVALGNGILSNFGLSFEQILGLIFSPFGYLLGLEEQYVTLAGKLLGTKIILNEFVAYGFLGKEIAAMDPRTATVLTIAVSGFANIGSMAIVLAAIGRLCPAKKELLAQIIFKGTLGGFLLSILNAMIVGLVMFV